MATEKAGNSSEKIWPAMLCLVVIGLLAVWGICYMLWPSMKYVGLNPSAAQTPDNQNITPVAPGQPAQQLPSQAAVRTGAARSVPPSMSADDQASLIAQISSDDEDKRKDAILRLHALAASDPELFCTLLPKWMSAVMGARAYDDVLSLAESAIAARPFDPDVLVAAQRATAVADMGLERYDNAAPEAKRYYNVAALGQTGDAVDLLSKILSQLKDDATADRLRMEQIAAAATPVAQPAAPPTTARSDVLSSIALDPSKFGNLLAKLGDNKSYGNLMGKGYLLLLSDRIADAQDCFAVACRASANGKELRQALEGIAIAMRDSDEGVARANSLISRVRQRDPAASSELRSATSVSSLDDFVTAATRTNLAVIKFSSDDQPALIASLQGADQKRIQGGIGVLYELISADPATFDALEPQWLPAILNAGAYDDVLSLTTKVILDRSADPDIVATAQKARVTACMALDRWPDAAIEAKRYYDVCGLAVTADAIDLVSAALEKSQGPQAAAQFRQEQMSRQDSPATQPSQPANTDSPDSAGSGASALASISTEDADYEAAIAALAARGGRNGQYPIANSMARGNLFLLCGRAADAKACFQAACRVAAKDKEVRQSVEGVARAMRAQDEGV
ncbi:MAG: hypothetical protein ABSH22_23130, partial [Tepidisphaeraceae bacterium]